jgi:hypothetical protein
MLTRRYEAAAKGMSPVQNLMVDWSKADQIGFDAFHLSRTESVPHHSVRRVLGSRVL